MSSVNSANWYGNQMKLSTYVPTRSTPLSPSANGMEASSRNPNSPHRHYHPRKPRQHHHSRRSRSEAALRPLLDEPEDIPHSDAGSYRSLRSSAISELRPR